MKKYIISFIFIIIGLVFLYVYMPSLFISQAIEDETRDIYVKTIWEDEDSSLKPKSIRINILNGETIVTHYDLDVENEDNHTFTDLKKLDTNGELITYKVSEEEINDGDLERYVPEYSGDMDSGFTIMNHTNRNDRNLPGHHDLTVKKTVEGTTSDKNYEYDLNVKISKNNYNLSTNEEFSYTVFDINDNVKSNGSFSNGKTNILLKNGEYFVIYNIPEDYHYEVIELKSFLNEMTTTIMLNGEVYSYDGREISNFLNFNDYIEFINTNDLYELSVKKFVHGDDEDYNREFDFSIHFYEGEYSTSIASKDDINYTIFDGDNAIYNGILTNGSMTFKLKDSYTIRFYGVPNLWHYEIKELNAQGFITTINSEFDSDRLIEGQILDNETIEYSNTRLKSNDLTIEKTVRGNLGDMDKEFNFSILLEENSYYSSGEDIADFNYTVFDIDGNPIYEDVLQKGEGTISLKHGQKVTIYNIYENLEYAVYEKNANDYDKSIKVNGIDRLYATGLCDEDVSIEFINTKDDAVVTGVIYDIRPYIVLVVISGLGYALFKALKKHEK